jgi:hypothetical protein
MYTHVSKCKNDKIKGEKCYFNSGKKKKKKKGKKKNILWPSLRHTAGCAGPRPHQQLRQSQPLLGLP